MGSPWRRNLRLFIAYRAGMSLLVYIAISLPFYQSLGFDLAQIGVLYALTGMTVFVFDIPTGFVADRIGYRQMMIAGAGIQAVVFALLAFVQWQWPVYILQIVLGFGQAVARGADGPLARTSATYAGLPFGRYARRGVAAMGLAEATASLITAGLAWQLAQTAPRVAVGLQAVVFLAVMYIPWKMHEERPVISAVTAESTLHWVRGHLALMAKVLTDELRRNRQALWLLCYGAVIGCTTQTVVPLVQPFFQEARLETWQFALVWAGYHVLWAGFSLVSGWYESWLGRWGALASLVVWGVVTNAAMVFVGSTVGLVVMITFYFIRGIQMPIILDYMTLIVAEDRRATLLGAQSTLQFGLYSVMSIVLGAVTESVSIYAAFAVSMLVYGTLGGVFIILLRTAR